jgi:hypothetical protein
MARADLKQMTRTPEAKLGHFIIEFATPGIGHILKQAGCDFALFDMEHSGFSIETVKGAVRYFEALNCRPSSACPQRSITTSRGRVTWVRKES